MRRQQSFHGEKFPLSSFKNDWNVTAELHCEAEVREAKSLRFFWKYDFYDFRRNNFQVLLDLFPATHGAHEFVKEGPAATAKFQK